MFFHFHFSPGILRTQLVFGFDIILLDFLKNFYRVPVFILFYFFKVFQTFVTFSSHLEKSEIAQKI